MPEKVIIEPPGGPGDGLEGTFGVRRQPKAFEEPSRRARFRLELMGLGIAFPRGGNIKILQVPPADGEVLICELIFPGHENASAREELRLTTTAAVDWGKGLRFRLRVTGVPKPGGQAFTKDYDVNVPQETKAGG